MPPDQYQTPSASPPSPQPNALRAAQYVRMSTEHQQYSTNNQADKILEYAQRRNIEIVRTEGSAEVRVLSAEPAKTIRPSPSLCIPSDLSPQC